MTITKANALNVYSSMGAASVSERLIADIQDRAESVGIKAVHALFDGVGSGLTVSQILYVDGFVELTPMTNFPEPQIAGLACLAEAFYAVDHEIRQRNLVCADPTRSAVLWNGIAFGVRADPTVVASAFAWATHPVSSIVSWPVADAIEDAWGSSVMVAGTPLLDWLARWADGRTASGVRRRFLPDDVIIQLATAGFREHRATR